QDDRRTGSLPAADVDDRLDPPHDAFHLGGTAGLTSDVVRAGENDDDLRVHAVELAVLEAPEDVLGPVAAPCEVGGVPAVERLAPVREEVRVVESTPSPRDRVAVDVHVDATRPCIRVHGCESL